MSHSPLSVHIQAITPEETYLLRHTILWPDKPFDYVKLADDQEGQHFGAFVAGELLAVISLFTHDKVSRFRKFATQTDWQGKGIGTKLLNHVIDEARRLGSHTLWCDARLSAADFYRRFGMKAEGETFFKGPIPYSKFSLHLTG